MKRFVFGSSFLKVQLTIREPSGRQAIVGDCANRRCFSVSVVCRSVSLTGKNTSNLEFVSVMIHEQSEEHGTLKTSSMKPVSKLSCRDQLNQLGWSSRANRQSLW